MTQLEDAIRILKIHGPTIDLFRSFIPKGLIVYWIQKETGWRRLSVSIDKVLIECGWSQAPVRRAIEEDLDPFSVFSGLKLACMEMLKDAAYWTELEATKIRNGKRVPDEDRRLIASFLQQKDKNLWYIIQMDYSIGTSALKKLASEAIKWGLSKNKMSDGLMNVLCEWSEKTELQRFDQWFGRQSVDQIYSRIHKHRDWIYEADKVSPLDEKPSFIHCVYEPTKFPPELKFELSKESDDTKRWRIVKRYVKNRAKKELTTKERIKNRLQEWFSRRKGEKRAVIREE